MKLTVEKLPKSEVKVTVEVDEQDLVKYTALTAEQLAKEVKIAGFREGKAPADVVEKHVGAERFRIYVLDNALSGTYAKAIIDEKLQVVTSPKIKVLSEKPFKYEATAALMPETIVKDYKKIEVPKEAVTVEEKEIQEAVKDFQKYYATLKTVDRPAKKGDRVEIDFEGTDFEGKALDGTKSANHPLVIGEGMLIPGFEENLEGMKKEEVKSFNTTFPKDYHHKPFQGKVVNFKVTMRKLEEVILPEITEDFIEQATGTRMTADALKERIQKNMEAEKEGKNRMKREDKFLEQVLKQTETQLPDMLVTEEVEYMMEELKADLDKKKMDMKTYLERMKKDEKALAVEMKTEAEKRLKLRFALNFLFKEEGVMIEDGEMEKEIELITQNFPESERAKVREEYENRSSRAQLKNRLMIYKLFEKLLHGGKN